MYDIQHVICMYRLKYAYMYLKNYTMSTFLCMYVDIYIYIIYIYYLYILIYIHIHWKICMHIYIICGICIHIFVLYTYNIYNYNIYIQYMVYYMILVYIMQLHRIRSTLRGARSAGGTVDVPLKMRGGMARAQGQVHPWKMVIYWELIHAFSMKNGIFTIDLTWLKMSHQLVLFCRETMGICSENLEEMNHDLTRCLNHKFGWMFNHGNIRNGICEDPQWPEYCLVLHCNHVQSAMLMIFAVYLDLQVDWQWPMRSWRHWNVDFC